MGLFFVFICYELKQLFNARDIFYLFIYLKSSILFFSFPRKFEIKLEQIKLFLESNLVISKMPQS